MSTEEIKIFRKLKKEEEMDANHQEIELKGKELEDKFKVIIKKIEDRHVISREEFRIYEKHEKFETYTKDWYPFQCPKCSESYDVIIRGNTANEKIVQIIYVEEDNIEKNEN